MAARQESEVTRQIWRSDPVRLVRRGGDAEEGRHANAWCRHPSTIGSSSVPLRKGCS